MKKIKKIISVLLAGSLLTSSVHAFPETKDERIFTDPVRAEYYGRANASAVIQNISFTDLKTSPVFEPVTRLGALNIIKGTESAYRPADNTSNIEMLSSVFRAIGLENDATQTARQVNATLPQDSGLRTELKSGYLGLANRYNLINGVQYGQALADQTSLDPAVSFIYDGPVTRQQAAKWLYDGLRISNLSAFDSVPAVNVQTTFNFSDWNLVSIHNLEAVEKLVAAGALTGSNGRLNPNGYLSKADFARMYKALDNIIYDIMDVEKFNGTVGGIRAASAVNTGSSSAELSVYIRSADGKVDVIKNTMRMSASAPAVTREVPVFKDAAVSNLAALEEGDEIEYLIRRSTNEVLYIEVREQAPAVTQYVRGKFRSLDFENGAITIEDESGTNITYTLAHGINFSEVNAEGETIYYIMLDNKKQPVQNLPLGSTIIIRLTNNIGDELTYVGEPNIVDEFRGIVMENNPDLGYLIVFDNQGRRIIKDYYPSDIRVKKREYYQAEDTIGYIDEVFPNFRYNPLESNIESIEPGDIVFIVNDPDEPDYIKSISAATNYIARYGKILQFTYNEDGYYEMLLEYENKQTSWFDVSEHLFISKNGKPVNPNTVIPGDWARVLVNQAVIGPGYVMESVKEIVLEGEAHNISTILRGQLAGLNPTQNKLLIQNVHELTADGWRNYKQASDFDIKARDIEYYHNDKRIDFAYANRYFKRADIEVYIALENNFAGEKVRKVTFRDGRDSLMGADTIVHSDGNGNFYTSAADEITTDSGTIVRRHGRLVSGVNIMDYDYAVVSLNNGNTAAIVDIIDTPGNSGIMLHRGGVSGVDERNNFQVRSFSSLDRTKWEFSPIGLLYDINYKTTFVTAEGIFLNYDKFIDYISLYANPVAAIPNPVNAANNVYYIVTEGSAASWIVEAPYSTRAVTGIVYAVDEAEGKIYIKDSAYLSNQVPTIGEWLTPSTGGNQYASPTLVINVPANSLIFKNNKVVGKNAVETGNTITVMTPTLPTETRLPSGTELDGYIVFVDK